MKKRARRERERQARRRRGRIRSVKKIWTEGAPRGLVPCPEFALN